MSVLDPLVAAEALDALVAQVAVLGPDGRIVLVNSAWRRFAGEVGAGPAPESWTGIDYLDVCRRSAGPDGEEGPLVAAGIAAVLAGTRTRFTTEYPCDTPVRRRWFELQVTARTDGSGGAVVAHVDVTTRKEAEIERNRLLAAEQAARRRATFLAEAMEELERSLRLDRVAAALANLCVGTLADVAIVDMLDERRRVVRVAVAAGDPATHDLAQGLHDHTRSAGGADHPVRRTLRERTVVSGPIDEELLQHAFSPEHAGVVRALGVRSFVCIPLVGRAGVIGALTVTSRAAHHYAHGSDRATLEDLARRASLAIDNARMHSDMRDAVRVLQDGLRPAALPSIPGLDVAAVYRPAGSSLLVGGDFYDVTATGGAGWAATIGDVCGKGPGAAIVTGLTRHTARAAVSFGAEPEGVLRALDEALAADSAGIADDNRYCTAIHAQGARTEDGVVVRLATAGHVPPIVVRATGATEVLDCGGALLGLPMGARIGRAEVLLGPGDALVLYTDGLLDARAPTQQLFPDDLAAALSARAGAGPAALVHAAEAAALGDGPPLQRDDIAVLALGVAT